MIANMSLGQRAISFWLLTLAVLIAFVIYLDGGFNSEPLIFFGLLWIIDIVLIASIVLRCLRTYNVFGVADASTIGIGLPKLTLKPGIYGGAIVLSKFTFEIVLYIQLRYRSIDVLWMMVPLWVFLSLISIYLLEIIIKFHKSF